MVEQRKSCVTRRKRLDDLLEEQKKLQKELQGEEDTLEQMHLKHVDILQVQLEGKRQQKRDYELKLEQKMHKIERMQEEYQQLAEELQPFIRGRQCPRALHLLIIQQLAAGDRVLIYQRQPPSPSPLGTRLHT